MESTLAPDHLDKSIAATSTSSKRKRPYAADSDHDPGDIRVVKAPLDKIDIGEVVSQPNKTDTMSKTHDDEEDPDEVEL